MTSFSDQESEPMRLAGDDSPESDESPLSHRRLEFTLRAQPPSILASRIKLHLSQALTY